MLARCSSAGWTVHVARTRFIRFSGSSLDLEIFAYVLETDAPLFLAIQEELLLGIMDIIETSGTVAAAYGGAKESRGGYSHSGSLHMPNARSLSVQSKLIAAFVLLTLVAIGVDVLDRLCQRSRRAFARPPSASSWACSDRSPRWSRTFSSPRATRS